MKNKLARGGSWNGTAEGCRSAYRTWDSPSSRSYGYGFRVVKEVEPSPHVLRGGCWYTTAERCRSADRSRSGPSVRYDDFGFRVVKEINNEL
jgi:formylglycine-generating enzyme required for sulfatase activity